MTTPEAGEGVLESLAAYAHDAWSGWMLHLFKFGRLNEDFSFTIRREKVDRWNRQANTAYVDLPPEEKESDRIEARRMLAIMDPLVARAALAERLAEVLGRAKEWVEADENTHGREFGTGNEIRAVLADWDRVGKGDENGK